MGQNLGSYCFSHVGLVPIVFHCCGCVSPFNFLLFFALLALGISPYFRALQHGSSAPLCHAATKGLSAPPAPKMLLEYQ